MHAKDLRIVFVGKAVNVLDNFTMAVMCWHIVNSTRREFIFGSGGD